MQKKHAHDVIKSYVIKNERENLELYSCEQKL